MRSEYSSSAKVTGNENEEPAVLSEEIDCTAWLTRAWHWTRETANICIIGFFQRHRLNRSYHGQKFYVFLSHSGEQKDFVRKLCRDLEKKGMVCFFDENADSLPVGDDFAPHIFEAVKTCGLAVLLISKEFLKSKWPMLELSAAMKAGVKILPVFFMVTLEDLQQITPESFKQIASDKVEQVKWHQDLNDILKIDPLNFSKGGDEEDFRCDLEKKIWCMLPKHPQRYPVPSMQGKERMSQEVANFFKNVKPKENGVCIAGLYAEKGKGKSTLAKAFCNVKLGDFEGNGCYLDFSRDDSFIRIRLALLYLTECHQWDHQTPTSDQLKKILEDRRVLLVLDNISEETIVEVRGYVQAVTGKNSYILVCAGSRDFLRNHFKIDSKSCMPVPSLEDNEAIGILLEKTILKQSTLGPKDTSFASDIVQRLKAFHLLVLKDFGAHLFRKYGSDLSQWVSEVDGLVDGCRDPWDGMIAILDKILDSMGSDHQTIFMLLALYVPPNMSPQEVPEWLKLVCNKDISYIKEAVEYLHMHGLIEKFEDEIHINQMYRFLADRKAERMLEWLWWNGDPRSTRGLISEAPKGFAFAKLQSTHRMPHQISSTCLKNLLLLQLLHIHNKTSELHLEQMRNLISLTIYNCNNLAALYGVENLQHLAFLQIIGKNSMLKLPELSTLTLLQRITIDMPDNRVSFHLGNLTGCVNLREINVRCPCLVEFPRLHGLQYLEAVLFLLCHKVKGPLDLRNCVELRSIDLDSSYKLVDSLLLEGCEKRPEITWHPDK